MLYCCYYFCPFSSQSDAAPPPPSLPPTFPQSHVFVRRTSHPKHLTYATAIFLFSFATSGRYIDHVLTTKLAKDRRIRRKEPKRTTWTDNYPGTKNKNITGRTGRVTHLAPSADSLPPSLFPIHPTERKRPETRTTERKPTAQTFFLFLSFTSLLLHPLSSSNSSFSLPPPLSLSLS